MTEVAEQAQDDRAVIDELPRGTGEMVEAWLEDHRVKYERRAIRMDEIDWDESHRNQARVSMPVIPELVDRYATAMKNGDKFPPIVVYEPKSQRRSRGNAPRYVIIDGNQRAEAIQTIGLEYTWAYVVVDASAQQVSVLTYTANGKHGMPTSVEDRMVQAIYLVESGATMVMAARLMSVDDKRLRQLIKRTSTERRLVTVGVARWQAIGAQQIDRLAALRSDVVLKEAAQLVTDARMAASEVNEMVTAVNAKRSETQQLAVVGSYRKDREAEIRQFGSGIMKLPVRVRTASSAIGSLSNIDTDELSNEVASLDPDYKARLKVRANEAIRALRKIEGML